MNLTREKGVITITLKFGEDFLTTYITYCITHHHVFTNIRGASIHQV